MNDDTTQADDRLQHLLAVVARNREQRCRALLEEARAQARQTRQRAYREARARLHRQVLATREQARQQLASAEAQRQTRLRLLRHRADRELLDRAWEPLQARLQARWSQADSRRRWIARLLEQAAARLVERDWQIEHPPDWPETERAELATRLGREAAVRPTFTADAGIVAGLRIRAGATRLDGTLAGLLRDRGRIEAMMLATLNECRQRAAGARAADDGHSP